MIPSKVPLLLLTVWCFSLNVPIMGKLYTYGDGTTDVGTKQTGVYTFNTGFHYMWDTKAPVYNVYLEGYMTLNDARISFWDNTEALFTDIAGSYSYQRKGTSDIQQAQSDVRAAFPYQHPYNVFVPTTVAVLTLSNFTCSSGSATTPINTVQVVIIYNSENTVIMINIGDIGWWANPDGTYPSVGVSYRKSGNNYNYLIPGSGTQDLEINSIMGNSGENGTWIFVVSQCRIGQCILVPNAYGCVSAPVPTDVGNYTCACLEGRKGEMCQLVDYPESPLESPTGCNGSELLSPAYYSFIMYIIIYFGISN